MVCKIFLNFAIVCDALQLHQATSSFLQMDGEEDQADHVPDVDHLALLEEGLVGPLEMPDQGMVPVVPEMPDQGPSDGEMHDEHEGGGEHNVPQLPEGLTQEHCAMILLSSPRFQEAAKVVLRHRKLALAILVRDHVLPYIMAAALVLAAPNSDITAEEKDMSDEGKEDSTEAKHMSDDTEMSS